MVFLFPVIPDRQGDRGPYNANVPDGYNLKYAPRHQVFVIDRHEELYLFDANVVKLKLDEALEDQEGLIEMRSAGYRL